ncbi:S8 family serine peptidase [Nocardioides sp. SR21]|uniref:S8 family peptidase n=1 Tax=Nocardioides sp. SR21 TaxID=2919501 RepID=UPI001FAABA52|nr:S8 family serine peptidase [Nocardioides sp. SR21]
MHPSAPFSGRRRWRPTLLAVAVATPALLISTNLHAPAHAAAPDLPGSPDTPSSRHRVTLVTGDVVTVTTLADGSQVADVDRPDDAVGGVRVQESGGDLYVIPDEAVGLLGAHEIDPRLFDVTTLIEMGYDDAGTRTVPLIVSYTQARARVAAPAAPRASRTVRRLPVIDGAAIVTPKPRARTFWTSIAPADPTDPTPSLRGGVAKLWLDGRVQVSLKDSVPQIGAPAAWAKGLDGTGVTVAVLDTGIDASHPDLATQIDGTESFVPGEGMADVNGHGTHVASTIVGTGAASDGENRGVAPGADLIVGKVLGGPEGNGQDSWVMAGMQWAAESGAEVVNMSLGDVAPSDGSDPMSQAVDTLSAQYGTLFVIAAGNSGPETISSPGAAASALTVGAVDKQDALASFSSTGPLTVTGAIKPDLSAPGVDITAARSQDMTDGGSGMYRTISGTSMATPHVAGAAAILAQQHPGWTGEQLKEQLVSSTHGLDPAYSPYEVGTGRLDVAAAVDATVRGTGSLFFGNYTWPHDEAEAAVTHDLTFTNTGDQDVTLDLALAGGGQAFTLGESTVTVPAGAKAVVPVTGDPMAAGLGRHVGYVVGTDAATGTPVTRTSLALLKEDERYDLDIKLVDRNGAPAATWVSINRAGDPLGAWGEYVDGEKTLRLPPGTYSVTTYLDVQGERADRSGLAVLVDPETVLDESTEVVLDAREANLLQTAAPQRTEDRQRKVDLSIVDESGLEFRSAYAVSPDVDDVYVAPTDPMEQGSFILTTRWRKGEPALTLSGPHGRHGRRHGGTIDTLVQPGSTVGTTTDSAATVYARSGAAADYQGLDARGRIVVVERTESVSPEERAAAAVAAGALALVVVNDGVGGLQEYVGDVPIPVAGVHRDAGAVLVALAKRGTRLTLRQAEFPSYVYDLTREYPGQVPDRAMVYRPSQRDLARIDASYYAVKPTVSSGYRYDVTLSPSLGFEELEQHPATRVEWVTPDQAWVESHAQGIDTPLYWPMVSGVTSYDRGEKAELDWFRPTIRPGFSDSFGVFNSRAQDYMTFNVQPWSSFNERVELGGFLPWGETPTHLQVFQGDTLIHDNPYSADMQWKEVPAGNLPYRVVLDAERPADIFRLSTRTHTEWEFMSDTVDSDYFEPFSVMELDYRVETDLRGDIRAGAKQRISVLPSSMDLGEVPGKLTRVSLEVSYDGGATWRTVRLSRGSGGWWDGTLDTAKRPGGFVSVRASAATDAGYSIEQEVISAYGLR